MKKNENGRKKKKKKEKIRNTSRYAERSFFESKGYLAPVGSIESVRKHFILRLFRWVLGKVTFYLHAFFLLFCITWKSAKNTWGKKSKTALNLPNLQIWKNDIRSFVRRSKLSKTVYEIIREKIRRSKL